MGCCDFPLSCLCTDQVPAFAGRQGHPQASGMLGPEQDFGRGSPARGLARVKMRCLDGKNRHLRSRKMQVGLGKGWNARQLVAGP